MSVAPSAQDVADALAITLEREEASGAPWCPPGDAAALRKWVVTRSASLGTGIRRATRLARLMAVADGRTNYVRFLYEQVGPLRARRFRDLLERALAEGRLPDSVATLTGNGVLLREASLAPQGAATGVFEIDFAQMPRLAALLDFMHNALGFAAVADLMSPLLPKLGPPKTNVEDVARALHAALNAWLGARLDSGNHILQAQHIRRFVLSRGRLLPETIDDEAILLFWIAIAETDEPERIEGFRLYRSVAMAMLRYRRALRDAMAERDLEEALSRGLEPANDDVTSDHAVWKTVSWRSPLRVLCVPPAARVKWLTAREHDVLRNYLGGPADKAADEALDPAEEEDDGAWRDGLGGDERFDLAHWLTLLRADVYGAVQASIVGRLRKRGEPQLALAQAMDALAPTAYAAAAQAYAELRAQLHLESLAALALLMETGATEAVVILHNLGGAAAVGDVLGGPTRRRARDDDEDDDDEGDEDEDLDGEDDARVADLTREIAPRLMAAIADANTMLPGAGRALVLEAIAARRKVSRAGFRRDDRADPATIEALRSGAAAVFDVIRELERLGGTLAAKTTDTDCAGDRARFDAAFRRIYLSAPAKI